MRLSPCAWKNRQRVNPHHCWRLTLDLAKIDKGCSPNEIVGVEQKRRNAVTVESPVGARFGDSPHFLRSPTLPAPAPESARLEAPLSWRADGEGLSPAVQAHARRFGCV